MPASLAAIGISLGSKLLGGLFGGRKRKRAARRLAEAQRKAREAIAEAGKKRYASLRSSFQGAFAELQSLPELDIDTTFAEQAYADARNNADSQFGRSLGEEMARDSVRETTANAIGRARQVGGSTADLLGSISDITDQERVSMRDIDFASIGAREERIQNAMSRLEGAAARRADFFRSKELAEFQADTARREQFANFKLNQGSTLSDAQYQIDMTNAQAGLDASKAAANVDRVSAQNISNTFGTIGDAFGKLGFGALEGQFDLDDIFGGGGGSRKLL